MDVAKMILNASLELEELLITRIDTFRGIDFAKRYVDGAVEHRDSIIHYETIRARQFNRILSAFSSIEDSSKYSHVLDYGCGKGYLLHLLSLTNDFTTIRGIEILPELCSIAIENLHALGDYSITVECADAREYDDIDDIDTFLMFNPFPELAMRQVVHHIEESLLRKNRRACIIYINNMQERLLLESSARFKKATTVKNLPRYGCESAIYIHS